MANYSPNDVLTMCAPFVKGVPTTAMQYIAFDAVHATIWKAFPWYWTLKALTAVALVDGTQDYTNGNASDFMRLVTARVTRTDVTPNRYQELTVTHFMPPELNIKTSFGNFKLICTEPQTRKLRLETAALVPTGTTLRIDGTYQYQPTKIDATNFTTALLSPDYHVQAYVDGLIYWLYVFTNDSRAIAQLNIFRNTIREIAGLEDSFAGDEFIFPTDSIGASIYGRVISGVFGP